MLIDATFLLLFPARQIEASIVAVFCALVSMAVAGEEQSTRKSSGKGKVHTYFAGQHNQSWTDLLTTVRTSQVYLSLVGGMNERTRVQQWSSKVNCQSLDSGHWSLATWLYIDELLLTISPLFIFIFLAHSLFSSTKHVYIYLFIFIVIFAIFCAFCALYLYNLCCHVVAIKSIAFLYKDDCFLNCSILLHLSVNFG